MKKKISNFVMDMWQTKCFVEIQQKMINSVQLDVIQMTDNYRKWAKN